MTDIAYEKGAAFRADRAHGRARSLRQLAAYFDANAFRPMTAELFLPTSASAPDWWRCCAEAELPMDAWITSPACRQWTVSAAFAPVDAAAIAFFMTGPGLGHPGPAERSSITLPCSASSQPGNRRNG
jgi:hypothetical protein